MCTRHPLTAPVQVAMWGWIPEYPDRPTWIIATFLPLSLGCGVLAAVLEVTWKIRVAMQLWGLQQQQQQGGWHGALTTTSAKEGHKHKQGRVVPVAAVEALETVGAGAAAASIAVVVVEAPGAAGGQQPLEADSDDSARLATPAPTPVPPLQTGQRWAKIKYGFLVSAGD